MTQHTTRKENKETDTQDATTPPRLIERPMMEPQGEHSELIDQLIAILALLAKARVRRLYIVFDSEIEGTEIPSVTIRAEELLKMAARVQ